MGPRLPVCHCREGALRCRMMDAGRWGAAGRVAWVTGASRGVGRGIAVALGDAGWIVYVTARSSGAGRTDICRYRRGDRGCGDGGRRSGHGVRCDHRDDAAVAAVAERIGSAQGRLDLLVNNVWGGYQRLNAGAWQKWNAPLWEQPLNCSQRCLLVGCALTIRPGPMCAVADQHPGKPGSDCVLRVPESSEHDFGAAYAMSKRPTTAWPRPLAGSCASTASPRSRCTRDWSAPRDCCSLPSTST